MQGKRTKGHMGTCYAGGAKSMRSRVSGQFAMMSTGYVRDRAAVPVLCTACMIGTVPAQHISAQRLVASLRYWQGAVTLIMNEAASGRSEPCIYAATMRVLQRLALQECASGRQTGRRAGVDYNNVQTILKMSHSRSRLGEAGQAGPGGRGQGGHVWVGEIRTGRSR